MTATRSPINSWGYSLKRAPSDSNALRVSTLKGSPMRCRYLFVYECEDKLMVAELPSGQAVADETG